MEVKIGIQHAAREVVVDTNDDREAIIEKVTAAVSDDSVLSLTDLKGRTVVIPGSKVAYVEIGGGTAGAVGFRSKAT
ncbi:MAG: DUF3107 domain-containing protein [Nocardioides sp.]|nr:DUF3107 domain-containing protein [Nocardioides sp.]